MKKSRFQKAIASLLSFTFAFMVFSFSFAPKAYAAEVNISVTYGMNLISNGAATTLQKDATTPVTSGAVMSARLSGKTYNMMRPYVITSGVDWHSGIAKLYVSFYNNSSNGSGTTVGDFSDPDSYISYYDNSNGARIETVGADSVSTFQSSGYGGEGYALEFSWRGSEGLPITRLAFSTDSSVGYNFTTSTNGYMGLSFPSVRLVSTAVSAELDALDKVADEIAAQSDLLVAMKGDLVAILQDIYTMTGDMYIAQNLLNTYVSQMLPLLERIDQTTINIYSLLSSQLAALETAINASASTIEAAIEAQTAAMIAYLEEMFNTGNEVPGETYEQQQDAENILDQMESLEKPDVETIVPNIGDIDNDDISGALSSIFSSNLIVTMMTLSASLAFGAYVLFGKRS